MKRRISVFRGIIPQDMKYVSFIKEVTNPKMYCGRLTGAHSTIITRDRTGPLFLMDQFPPIFLTHLA